MTLAAYGVAMTDQARETLVQSLMLCPDEIAGDSDGLLTGLLHSGSYTVDVVESAGVSAARLRELALASTWRNADVRTEDPIATLFRAKSPIKAALDEALASGGPLETRHILKAALSPRYQDQQDTDDSFPFSVRRDRPAQAGLQRDMEFGVAELISYATAVIIADEGAVDIEHDNVVGILTLRHDPITSEEDWKLDRYFGINHAGMTIEELDYIIAAMNAWFVHRRILTDPPDLCLSTIARTAAIPFAPGMFVEEGGNLKAVEYGLRTAERFSPERDLTNFALFEQNGRIHVGEYTYRNTFTSPGGIEVPYHRVSIQAVRPVSLVAEATLRGFEEILSNPRVSNSSIHNFLSSHPELLESLGYQSVHPHLCLTADDDDARRDLVPNFLLNLPGQRGFDILDLRLPRTPIMNRDPRARVSSDILRAVAQLRDYAKFFDIAKNRRAFAVKYGLEAFRPQVIVLIGRDAQFHSREERREIEEQVRDVKLLTYDDLIAYGRSRSLLLPGGGRDLGLDRGNDGEQRIRARIGSESVPAFSTVNLIISDSEGVNCSMNSEATDAIVSGPDNESTSPTSAPGMRRADAERVTFGIVTALEKEYVAMKAMLESPVEHVVPRGRIYVCGQVPAKGGGVHCVALALADQGTAVATHRATLLAEDFADIEAILMVGIAGGVPNITKPEHHVRLGDLVASGEHGVIAYDFVKEHATRLEPRHPPRPPHAGLYQACRRLVAATLEGRFPWSSHIARAAHLPNAARPVADTDRLADTADQTRWVEHPFDPERDRNTSAQRVFLGTIACANRLLRNPLHRDQLRDDYEVRAVEMEGFGIAEATWNQNIGYLVIRGICDYCDTHKVDTWHGYASIMAAAFARAVLEEMPVTSRAGKSAIGV